MQRTELTKRLRFDVNLGSSKSYTPNLKQELSGPMGPLFLFPKGKFPHLAVIVITVPRHALCSNMRMNTRHVFIGFAALAVTIAAPALADNIYKWTDADGNVHYEDRPSGDQGVERLTLTSTRTNNSVVQNRVQARQDSQAARQEAKNIAADEARTAEEEKAQAEQRKKQCANHRAKLQDLLQSSRLYRLDDKGERVYLDEVQSQESRQRAEELVTEYCEA